MIEQNGERGATNVAGAAGGLAARVSRTGIALVHEGELILPPAGSEAEAEVIVEDARTVAHYYFPVEIEVRMVGAPVDHHEMKERALDALALALDGL